MRIVVTQADKDRAQAAMETAKEDLWTGKVFQWMARYDAGQDAPPFVFELEATP